MTDEKQQADRQLIVGRNAVLEAIKADRSIDMIYIASEGQGGSLGKIKAMARDRGIVVKTETNQKLDFMCGKMNHQGVIASIACADYCTVEDILKVSEKKKTAPFIIIADEIEDPHNLGAIIRTAEAWRSGRAYYSEAPLGKLKRYRL